jgi:hypothetical protein
VEKALSNAICRKSQEEKSGEDKLFKIVYTIKCQSNRSLDFQINKHIKEKSQQKIIRKNIYIYIQMTQQK